MRAAWTDEPQATSTAWDKLTPALVGSVVTLLVLGIGVLIGSHLVNLETRAQLRYVEQRYEWSQEKAQKAIFENRELKGKMSKVNK